MYSIEELAAVVEKLRSQQGCPWDRKQTFESLKPYLMEEAGEVIQAIDNRDMENLCEELGDLLFHVVMYSQIAQEQGGFQLADVVDGACRKMVRRHPYVFGEKKGLPPEESLDLWNEMKKREKTEKP
ncbi:MAG: nucleotide pyrophosphohydrolase [Lachnospiraceae bacterium]|nr:nucleotide pyrophosphohydrolase [Lachnospiraceae bacterium]